MRIPLVTASEPGRVVWRSVLSDRLGPSPMERSVREGESPARPGPCRTTRRCRRVGCPSGGRSAAWLHVWTVAGRASGPSPGGRSRPWIHRRCGWGSSARRLDVPLRTPALLAPARRLPIQPALKHGPRSLTCVRADGRENPEGERKIMGGIPLVGCTANRPQSSVKGSSESMPSGPKRW